MISYRYNISISDEKYEFESGVTSMQTVTIQFVDREGDEIKRKSYGLVDVNSIYEKIEKGEEINLNHAYVKNFSLTEYRKLHQLDERTAIYIEKFSAENAFFDCSSLTDFSFVVFKSNCSFKHSVFAKGNINFYKSVYHGLVDYSEVNFGKGNIDFDFSEFGNHDTTFENAIFPSGDVRFVNCNFGDGTISFKNVNFGNGKVDFHFSDFGNGWINFDKSIFSGPEIDFRRISFGEGKVDFRRINFGDGHVHFDDGELKSGKMSFRSSKFGSGNLTFNNFNFGDSPIIFDNAYFGTGKVSFFKCFAHTLSFKECQLDCYIDLRVSKVFKIDLTDVIVRDVLDLRKGTAKVELESFVLYDARVLGQIYIEWEENECNRIIRDHQNVSYRDLSNQYRLLKENFNHLGRYNDEDEAYVEFKRFELRADLKEGVESNKLNSIWLYPKTIFSWLIFDKMGKYATDPIRVLISTTIIYVIFSLAYFILPMFINAEIIQSVVHPDHMGHALTEAFYHSAITFLTIGYGDFFPSGHFKWISAFEGWVGLFLMSYFTVAFVRKILR